MPYSKGAQRTMRRYGRKRTSKKRSTRKVSKSVKKYVKREIHKQVETKSFYVQSGVNTGSVLESPDWNTSPILFYPAYHTLPLGVSNGNRIGNRCMLRKVYLRYTINPLPYDAATNVAPSPQHVMLILYRLKQAKAILPTSTDLSKIFDNGGGSFAANGTLTDLLADYNRDYFDIAKSWREKVGYAAYDGTGALPAQQNFNNNDYPFNVVRKLDITKYLNKVMIFDDSTATVQNNNLFFGFVSVNGTGNASGATQLTIKVNWSIQILYEDA